MEVKGPAVKSIVDFIKNNYKERFDKWIDSLPESSKKIMKNPIYATSWYPIEDGVVAPTRKMAEMFFKNSFEAAWQSGRYSADVGLKGVYRIFVKATKPSFIISRANNVFTSYYKPSEMIIADSSDKHVIVHITKFAKPNAIVEYRIAGWMERALEISGCKDLKVFISQSLTKGDPITEFKIRWN